MLATGTHPGDEELGWAQTLQPRGPRPWPEQASYSVSRMATWSGRSGAGPRHRILKHLEGDSEVQVGVSRRDDLPFPAGPHVDGSTGIDSTGLVSVLGSGLALQQAASSRPCHCVLRFPVSATSAPGAVRKLPHSPLSCSLPSPGSSLPRGWASLVPLQS